MRVPRQRAEVGDAVVAGAGRERVLERQRGERREAAGGAAPDAEPGAVDVAARDEVAGDGSAVLDVDDPPPAVQQVAEGPSVPGRATVVDVDDGEAAGRPELVRQLEVDPRRRRRAAVDDHDQRRTLPFGARPLRVVGVVQEGVGDRAVAGWELDRFRDRPPRVVEAEVPARHDRVDDRPPFDQCDRSDVQLGGRRRGDEQHRRAVGRHRGDRRERQVERRHRPVGGEHGETVDAVLDVPERDAAIVQEREARFAEPPVREADVVTDLDHRFHGTITRVPAVQAPEPGPVAAEPQRPIGRPRRLAHRLPLFDTRDHRARHAVGHDEARRVPWHVRVIPLDPAPRRAVRRPARAGDEVDPRHHDRRLGGIGRGQPHDGVDGLRGRRRVVLAHAEDRRPVRRDVTIGVAQPAPDRRLRRQRHGRGIVRTQAVESLAGPVGEPQHTVTHPPRTAAVLVHGGAGAPGSSQDLAGRPVRRPPQDGDAPTLLGAPLGPPHVVAVGGHRADRPRRPHDELARHRSRPGAVGTCRHGTEGTGPTRIGT